MRPIFPLLALALLPSLASAQDALCVPGSPFYERGDYRCFPHRPQPTRARASVRATVEGGRYLSGGGLDASTRERIEDHFDALGDTLAEALPSLVDGRGGLHTPDVRLSVVLLPSGDVGRVRVLSRLGDPFDRRIAQALVSSVSEHGGLSVDGSEVEVIVRLHPQLHFTRWRNHRSPPPCCYEDD
ncbi:MAG: hypothetical protein EPO40_18125 [Myxococcaceae bacterium]|nr:hypothetical protein [Deltaproteobacteria bacterium]TAK27534.1 MAG: hypothetical protein EPO40_18125 [Myxococcaceae bacterium]